MPVNKTNLDISNHTPQYKSPGELLQSNPDKAYTAEEIHERTRYPLTMVGLQMYLESVKAGMMPSLGYKRSEGKDYYYWNAGSGEEPTEIPIEEETE
ncbi:MAG: hypothetical protein ABEI06_10830 [Halobacteriaceae archaeon]